MPVVYELGASIKTPYGFGICIATGSLTPAGTPVVPAQIKLRSWTLANSKNPSLYTFDNTWDLIVPDVEVGCDVMTPYGRGRVLKLEDTETDVYTESPVCAEVILTEWRLANNSRVRCYLNFSDLSYLPSKKFGELTSLEKIETANSKRESAKEPLSRNDLDAANALYTQACFYLQTIDNDTLGNNYDRACLLECMIACKNNGAMCCVKLKRWKEANQLATEAVMLLDALYKQRGLKIHAALNSLGLTDETLFYTWRVKGLYYASQARAEMKDYENAVEVLKTAMALSGSLASLASWDVKVKKLLTTCKARDEALKKKEKKAAIKMFGGGSKKSDSKSEKTQKKEDVVSPPAPTSPSEVKEKVTPVCPISPISPIPTRFEPKGELIPPPKKAAAVAEKKEEKKEGEDGGEIKEEGFLKEHGEALLVLGLGALAIGLVAWLRKK